MSGRARAQRLAIQALSDDESPLAPLGTCGVQLVGGSSRMLNYPASQARAYGIDPGTTMYQFLDPETGAIVYVPEHALNEEDVDDLP